MCDVCVCVCAPFERGAKGSPLGKDASNAWFQVRILLNVNSQSCFAVRLHVGLENSFADPENQETSALVKF